MALFCTSSTEIKRARSTFACGVAEAIIKNFRYEDEEYLGGKIYDLKSGETYDAEMWLEGTDLKLRGFVGFSMFGRMETFERVEWHLINSFWNND